MIPFNRPPYTGNEDQYVQAAIHSDKMSGDGHFGQRCQHRFEEDLGCAKALLTPSCTQALEMAAILVDIQPGDEVIMPSYTFVSTANAFVLRGATIVFVDIRPDTMNINECLIEAAITAKTKVIVPVHYAGVSCEMDVIMEIARRHGLFVVEDAAQGVLSSYKGRPLGTMGHMAAFSFHETKNITSGGEGGLLIINDAQFVPRAEIIREKGTNRNQYFRGMVDKYSWVDLGSSYLPSEMQAAYLWGQLERVTEITQGRIGIWNAYHVALSTLEQRAHATLPVVPSNCVHNGHMFYLKVANLQERVALIAHLKADEIYAVFHYVPLHSAQAGGRFSRFHGKDEFTTRESERLIRLPIFHGMDSKSIEHIIESVLNFYG